MTVIANTTIEVLAAAFNLVARQATNTTDPPKAPDQGGLINPGHALNPAKFDASNPIRLLFIQLGIILTCTTLVAIPFRYIRQPKVIAEILVGIILGPSVMGHVAGFTDHIFPQQSRSYLSLVANTGLVVYLFIIGLELDTFYLRKNIKLSAMIGAGGMALPFSVGIGFATVLFREYINTGDRTNFIVFIGVCFSITAFPVLCRILTALNLLDTTVGISVLAAGVGNDIIAWVLLALAVALVNAVNGVTALYILLVTVAWGLVVLFPIRWALRWLAYKTGSVENGPSQTYLTVVLLVQFASAFFTDIIGVHPIFGAFLVGIAVPRDGNLAIRICEKIEDFVMIIMLPLYFTLSGLNTNLSELNTGKDWGFIVAIATLDFSGKFISTSSMARLAGFKPREALAVGSLMSCKGLVELVVLNVGLTAHILPRRLFSMFVVEALVLTSMTSPLVMFIYPPRLQTKIHGPTIGAPPPRDAEGSTDEKDGESSAGPSLGYSDDDEVTNKSRFLAVLDKAENLSAMLSLTQLFQPRLKPTPLESKRPEARRPAVDSLRLIELSDRTSAVMMGQNTEAMLHSDPLVSTYRTFTGLNDLAGSASLSVAEADHFATSVDEHATARNAQLVLAAWVLPYVESPGSPGAITTRGESVAQSNFLRNLFVSSSVDVALSVESSNPSAHAFGRAGKKHIFLPFFGGPDDRLALKLLIQIVSASPDISASVVRVTKSDLQAVETAADSAVDDFKPTVTAGVTADTVYGNVTTQTRLQSETADNILLAKLQAASSTRTPAVTEGLKRITFSSETTPTPLARVAELAHAKKASVEGDARFVVFIGRSRRMATENHGPELAAILKERGAGAVGSDVRRAVGDVASALALSELGAGLVIIQAVVSRD